MKQIILLYSLIFMMSEGYSQISSGTISIGGNISIAHSNDDNDESKIIDTEIKFNPAFGYFILDNLEVSVGPILSKRIYNSTRSFYEFKNVTNNYGLNLSINKYFLSGSVLPYIGLSIGTTYSEGNSSNTDLSDYSVADWTSSGYVNYINGKFGIAIRISNGAILKLSTILSYSKSNQKDKYSSSNNYIEGKKKSILFSTGIYLII